MGRAGAGAGAGQGRAGHELGGGQGRAQAGAQLTLSMTTSKALRRSVATKRSECSSTA